MFNHLHTRTSRRRGSVLLPVLFVVIVIVTLLGAILPLTVSGYGLSRADRDRAEALAAAEGGLNWEIGRINNRLWNKTDSGATGPVDGSGNPKTMDYWPTATGAAPGTASTVVLKDASGNPTQQLFIVGTSVDPFNMGAAGSFTITAEGRVAAADGHVVKRRVSCGGGGLISLFDTMAVFSFSPAASPSWSDSGNCTAAGGCGSNGPISGSGGPTITGGPLELWGSKASNTGVTVVAPAQTMGFPIILTTDTADAAASLLYSSGASTTAYTVGSWAPTKYDKSGNTVSPADSYGRKVNTQAEIVVNAPGLATDGQWKKTVVATDFLDASGKPVLNSSLIPTLMGTKDWAGSGYRLRLKPGVYYFAQISLQNNEMLEVANDWYKANGQKALWDTGHLPINGPPTTADYDSMGNRVTLFVDAITNYEKSSFGSGLYTALQGDKSATNALRYRRSGNFRIYAKNTGDFKINGSSSSPQEFNTNLLHYNKDASGNYYGTITLSSGCQIHGGLLAWTVNMSGGATVQQYGTGVFDPDNPVIVAPIGGSGGLGAGFGGWQWQEVAAS